VATIGSFATALGNAAKCDPWAVEIFAEEVVRGGPAFAISLVLSAVEPTLRQLAELGAWQVRTHPHIVPAVALATHDDGAELEPPVLPNLSCPVLTLLLPAFMFCLSSARKHLK
jgi:hypothetical protein